MTRIPLFFLSYRTQDTRKFKEKKEKQEERTKFEQAMQMAHGMEGN